jgi:anaerobic magnesium-protoporphyrin IX monomethyl ester cyclase
MNDDKICLSGVRFCLVFPPYRQAKDPVSFKEGKAHLGAIPPLSLAYVAGILEQYACTVKLIDASSFNLSKEETLKEIKAFNPDFLGFSVITIDFHNTLGWIAYLKQNIKVPVIIGGIQLSLYPHETMSHESIDYGVIGEAEETLPELVRCLLKGGDISQVKGVCYRKHTQIVVNETRPAFAELDKVPFPARHLLPNATYYSLISSKRNFTAMITTRGCPFSCIFCDNQSVPYRVRSPKNIVDEIEQCYKEFDIREIDIFDALFSVSEDRVIEICRELRRREIKISWSFRTRVDLITERMLDELKEAGCARIYYGIESGDPQILRAINKNVDLETIERIICLTKKKGIRTFGYFMVGNLGETKESIQKTLNLMLRLPLDYIQVSPVFAPPRSSLYAMVMKETGVDYWREYSLDISKETPPPRFGTGLSDKEINRFVRQCYLRFYLRPAYIMKAIIRFRSWAEVVRSFRALRDMVFHSYSR